ncbi:MAG TPA: lmo0937 family membrane protein [Gemmatimonadales bacterium]|nr:lmo0937 family membrane protein [Gemmatimonadales bacterium]
MFAALAVILLVAWLLGFVVFHVTGLIHLLLVIALVAFIWQLVAGRRSTSV